MPPEFSGEHLCVSKTKIYLVLGADSVHAATPVRAYSFCRRFAVFHGDFLFVFHLFFAFAFDAVSLCHNIHLLSKIVFSL